MERDTGDFVVAWSSYGQDRAATQAIVARQYSGSAAALTGEYLLNETTQYHEMLSGRGHGRRRRLLGRMARP